MKVIITVIIILLALSTSLVSAQVLVENKAEETVITYTPMTPIEVAASTLGVPASAVTYEHFDDGTIRYTIKGFSVADNKLQDMDSMLATENQIRTNTLKR